MDKKVTYVKVLGILFLCCALFILFASLAIGPSLNTITGIMLLLISILYLVNPAVVYNDEAIMTKNLWGMTLKSYHFNKDNITVQNRDIYADGKKIRLSKGMLVSSEYQALLDHIQSKSPQNPKDDEVANEEIGKNFLKDDEILDSDMT